MTSNRSISLWRMKFATGRLYGKNFSSNVANASMNDDDFV